MSLNGRLTAAELSPIAGGQLARAYALRWNLMNARVRAAGRPTIMPNGSLSSYRTFAGQVFERQHWCSLGKCQNAAVPGTSNHGWGRAVDNGRKQEAIRYGHSVGVRDPSDAPWEPWHTLVHLDPIVVATSQPLHGTIERGTSNKRATRHLKRTLHKIPSARKKGQGRWRNVWGYSGYFGPGLERAVKRFQRDHKLKADGVVGKSTWRALHAAAKR